MSPALAFAARDDDDDDTYSCNDRYCRDDQAEETRHLNLEQLDEAKEHADDMARHGYDDDGHHRRHHHHHHHHPDRDDDQDRSGDDHAPPDDGSH